MNSEAKFPSPSRQSNTSVVSPNTPVQSRKAQRACTGAKRRMCRCKGGNLSARNRAITNSIINFKISKKLKRLNCMQRIKMNGKHCYLELGIPWLNAPFLTSPSIHSRGRPRKSIKAGGPSSTNTARHRRKGEEVRTLVGVGELKASCLCLHALFERIEARSKSERVDKGS